MPPHWVIIWPLPPTATPAPVLPHHRQLLDAIQAEGEVFLTSTRLQGRLVMRLAVMAQNSHSDDVDLALERLAWHRQRLLN